MTRRALAVLAFVCAAAASAQAPDTTGKDDPRAVQPERPTVATHAGTVAVGYLEIEAGAERDKLGPAPTSLSTPVVFKIGVADHAQLSVFSSTRRAQSMTSFGDLGVGVKWRILDDAPIVGDFAVLPSIKLATGSAATGSGTGTTDGSLLLISSHDFGGIAMDINAGYTRRSGDGTNVPRDATLWTVSFGGPLADPVGWVAECYGFPATHGPAGQASIVALLGGPTFQIARWLVVDAGMIVPLSGPQPHALYAGGVYNVGHLWTTRH